MQWQHNLISPGGALKRPKLELADSLILMANSLYELGRRQASIDLLYLSLEAIHLSAAMMHSGMVGVWHRACMHGVHAWEHFSQCTVECVFERD